MREQTITITNLRSKTRAVIGQVQTRGKSVIVEVLGKPVAAIVGVDEFRELQELRRARAARKRRFALVRQSAQRNTLSENEAFALINEARIATSK